MDVFGLRQQVIGDYASYIRSFFTIRDERIRTKVDAALAEGHLWQPLHVFAIAGTQCPSGCAFTGWIRE